MFSVFLIVRVCLGCWLGILRDAPSSGAGFDQEPQDPSQRVPNEASSIGWKCQPRWTTAEFRPLHAHLTVFFSALRRKVQIAVFQRVFETTECASVRRPVRMRTLSKPTMEWIIQWIVRFAYVLGRVDSGLTSLRWLWPVVTVINLKRTVFMSKKLNNWHVFTVHLRQNHAPCHSRLWTTMCVTVQEHVQMRAIGTVPIAPVLKCVAWGITIVLTSTFVAQKAPVRLAFIVSMMGVATVPPVQMKPVILVRRAKQDVPLNWTAILFTLISVRLGFLIPQIVSFHSAGSMTTFVIVEIVWMNRTGAAQTVPRAAQSSLIWSSNPLIQDCRIALARLSRLSLM